MRDKYEADGITPKAESLLAAFDAVEALVGSGSALAVSTYEELLTILKTMVDEAKEQ